MQNRKEAEKLKFGNCTHVGCEDVDEREAGKTVIALVGGNGIGCFRLEAVVENLWKRYEAATREDEIA